jgi:phenylacetate-CoA ligase
MRRGITILRFLPRFQKAYRELEILKEREHWTRGMIESFQLTRINALWRHASTHVPYYRELISRFALPGNFSTLAEFTSQVPLLPRDAVKNQPFAFISEKAAHGSWCRTGGSTGKPMDIYWGHDAHLEVLRAKYRQYNQWGLDIFDRIIFLWGHAASLRPGLAGFLSRIKQPLEDRMRNRLRLSAYFLGRDNLQRYLRQIAAFRPSGLYGYGHAVFLLAQEAEKQGFHCDTLKLVILTGEPISQRIVETVENAFGAPAIQEYGSIECGVIAGEWTDRTLRVREDIVFLESIPKADGIYDLVLSLLTNHSFPMIRYSIGDVTSGPLKIPLKGFAILPSVDGRANDLLITQNGRLLSPFLVETLFDQIPGLCRYRVVQEKNGSLNVLLEMMEGQALLDGVTLERRLSKLVEGYQVKVDAVNAIPCMPSGKHCWILSEKGRASGRQIGASLFG